MLRKIVFFVCGFLINCHAGKAQIEAKDHPLLVKQLKTVFYDTNFKKEENRILNDHWDHGVLWYSTPAPIQSGKVCFTIQDCSLRFGATISKSKLSHTILPKGSMVWIVGHDPIYDSIRIDSNRFLYFVNYKVYIPSLKKIAFINGKYLPDFCISTRGYSNLDTLIPQKVNNFQQYHSLFHYVKSTNDKDFYNDTQVNILDFIENWIHINDRVFQFYVRKQPDSSQLIIYLETGIVNANQSFRVNAQNSTNYLGSNIFPWIYGSRGLMGVRNIIEIEHWAESCGQEGGSTFFTFMENADPTMELVKLGDFNSIADGDIYAYSETLIFPSDTISKFPESSSSNDGIVGKPNYIIQYNITQENDWQDAIEEYSNESNINSGENKSESETEIEPQTKTTTEVKFTKWNRNPLKFKKIKIVNPCGNKMD